MLHNSSHYTLLALPFTARVIQEREYLEKMVIRNVYFVRHGETDDNKAGIMQGGVVNFWSERNSKLNM